VTATPSRPVVPDAYHSPATHFTPIVVASDTKKPVKTSPSHKSPSRTKPAPAASKADRTIKELKKNLLKSQLTPTSTPSKPTEKTPEKPPIQTKPLVSDSREKGTSTPPITHAVRPIPRKSEALTLPAAANSTLSLDTPDREQTNVTAISTSSMIPTPEREIRQEMYASPNPPAPMQHFQPFPVIGSTSGMMQPVMFQNPATGQMENTGWVYTPPAAGVPVLQYLTPTAVSSPNTQVLSVAPPIPFTAAVPHLSQASISITTQSSLSTSTISSSSTAEPAPEEQPQRPARKTQKKSGK